jgi:hypothetical protein
MLTPKMISQSTPTTVREITSSDSELSAVSMVENVKKFGELRSVNLVEKDLSGTYVEERDGNIISIEDLLCSGNYDRMRDVFLGSTYIYYTNPEDYGRIGSDITVWSRNPEVQREILEFIIPRSVPLDSDSARLSRRLSNTEESKISMIDSSSSAFGFTIGALERVS